MEVVAIVAGAKNDVVNVGSNGSQKKSNRIQVSNTKKPLFFYVNLAKRYMRQHNEVELSALGMAIATVVTISEILKNNGLAIEKKILTSTVDMKDEIKGRLVQKAKIEILLEKTENFDSILAAAAASTASETAAASTASEIAAASTATTASEIAAASTASEIAAASTATTASEIAAAATASEIAAASTAATASETTASEIAAAAATVSGIAAVAATVPEIPAADEEKEDVKPTTIASVA